MRIEKAVLGSILAAALVGAESLAVRASQPMATAENAVASPSGWSLAGSAPEAYFDNMIDRPIKGTTDWTQYHVVLDVDNAAESISFGTLLIETGSLWLDDVELQPVPTTVPTTELSVAKNLPEQPVNPRFE